MTSIIICEKPSQARNVRAAIGSRYGEILAARGHLLRLAEPHEVNPDWKSWGYDLLRPESGFYPLKEDRADGKGELIDKIKRALHSASRVIIATDCDREGQAIGENLLRYFKYRGEVLRAMFSAEDETSLRAAFEALEPNSKHQPLYSAAVARAQADQIANLTCTRAVTCALRPQGMKTAIGIGRVKTPTMAIVCRREKAIQDFAAREYHNLALTVTDGAETVELKHAPKEADRIFDRDVARAIIARLDGWSGPISIQREARKQAPPKLMDLPTLQQRAAPWGWSASKTLDIAQALYETHKITTYPRAENKYLPETEAANAHDLIKAIAQIQLFPFPFDEPVIRMGKKGHFSDKGLAGSSHHAIIPNARTASKFAAILPNLSDDERRLFELIARSYAAALAPDCIYDYTAFSVVAADLRFAATGRIDTELGWKAIFAEYDQGDQGDDVEDGTSAFPNWSDGQIVHAGGEEAANKLIARRTTVPPRYTEGGLIAAMQNAWKFASDPEMIERLKETSGIGTPATRGSIIDGLKAQGFFTVQKNKLHASPLAMQIFDLLDTHAAELLDPTLTADMEAKLNAILTGDAEPRSVIDDICAQANALARKMRDLSASGAALTGITVPPSPGMLKAARDKAKREGKRLPNGAAQDRDICSAFLGPRSAPGTTPSEKQIAFAQKIAAASGTTVPDDALAHRDVLSKWIDTHKGNDTAREATSAQVGFAEKIAAAKGLVIPPETLKSGSSLSKWIDTHRSTGGRKARR